MNAGRNGQDRIRVVVTGVGLITPVGNDVESSWDGLLAGRSGGGLISHFAVTDEFDVRFACEVKDFEPERYLERKEVRRTDRFAQFAIAASAQAVEASGLMGFAGLDRDGVGVLIGSGIGGIATFARRSAHVASPPSLSTPVSSL